MRRNVACFAAWVYAVAMCTSVMSAADPGDTEGQHGLDHPAIFIDLPHLTCECNHSHGAATSQGRKRGASSFIETSACRDGGEVYWIVSVHGLVAGFVYKVVLESFVLGKENTHQWYTIFSSSTSSYTVRQLISQMPRDFTINTSVWDAFISKQDPFEIEVTVRDMHPGLTSEDALIGARRMNSADRRKTYYVHCNDVDSGEQTKVPDGEWQYNFSAVTEDVRVSYSETVVALAMLNRYGLDEWARISQNMSDDGHTVSDLHIPAVVFNRKQDGRRVFVEGMLRAVGFRDITFQPTYDIATLDLAALESSGRVSSANWDYFVKEQMGWKYISNASKMRYIAHALDFQDVIERHAAAEDASPGASSWIAVFEDDIVLTTSPVLAHKRLFEAVSSLPRNVDVLHVEWCWDWCEESRFHTSYPLISLASQPHCSAGVLLSTQGARKLDRLLRPIDSTIGNMLDSLCHRRAIYCYKLRLPIFTQDKKWGSNVDFTKQEEATHFHDFSLGLCNEVIHFDYDFWSWFDSVRNEYTDGASSSVVVSGRLKKANSTACSAQFLESSIHCLEKSEQIISGELKAANGYHGLDHPAVAIDVPELECECKDSFSIEAMEKSMEASACREGGEVYWILSVRGLVAGFVYEIRFELFVLKGKKNARHWSHTIFSSSTSSYTVRQPVSQISQQNRAFSIDTSVWHAFILKQDPFEIEVTVRDMHPGLTSEDALIGARRLNSAVNPVRLTCAKLPGTIHDKGFEHSIGQNGLDANSTAWRTSFPEPRRTENSDAAGQHGIHHPAVVVDFPVLECECNEYSPVASSTEYARVASSSCREGGQVDFNVTVQGLVPGFEYELEIVWTLEDDKLQHIWKSVVTAQADCYTFRKPLVQQNHDFHFGMLAWDAYKKGKIAIIKVTVRDMFPGLITEEARIGIRNIVSSVGSPFPLKSPLGVCKADFEVLDENRYVSAYVSEWQNVVIEDDTRLFGFVPFVGRNDNCSRTSAHTDRDLKTAIKSGTTISMSQIDRGETEKGEPNACTGNPADILCTILSSVSLDNQERDDCDRGRDSEQASNDLEGSGPGGETLQELMSLPSDFPSYLSSSLFPPPRPTNSTSKVEGGWEEDFNVTAVLNPWHRPQLFYQQLKALYEQTFRICQVWVVISASPAKGDLTQIMRETCESFNMSCYAITSDYNFVYFMPWQAALQATTRYVWFLDDDVLPGRNALALLLHVSNTLPYRYALLGGIASCIWPGLWSHPDYLIQDGYTCRHGVDYCMGCKMKVMRESENLDGSRFMLQLHVKLLFREEPGLGIPHWVDNNFRQQGKWLSNDLQLTYSLRKYAGIKSFVLPCVGAPEMCVDRKPHLGWEGGTTCEEGDPTCTRGTRTAVRRDYIYRMFTRGHKQVWTKRLRHYRKQSVMVFAHSRIHAYNMARLRLHLQRRGFKHVYVTITGLVGENWADWGSKGPRDTTWDAVTEDDMPEIFDFSKSDYLNQIVDFFSLKIGFDYPRKHSPENTLADTLIHFKEVLKTTRPLIVFLPLSNQKAKITETRAQQQRETQEAVVKGAQLAADYAGIPVVWISNESSMESAVDNMDEFFTVIDHYRLREIRATDAAALCVFYNKALGAESKTHFHPLGQQTDDTTCMHITSGSAGQSYSHRMDLIMTSASSANSEGRIVGWAFWTMTDCGAEIGIALADAQQGRSLEKKLMQALIHKAEEKQLAELMLNVYLDNDRAIAMYHNFGFKIESTFKGSTGKQEHMMRLILPQK